jgi:DNA-binding transcriptional regulator PaaX
MTNRWKGNVHYMKHYMRKYRASKPRLPNRFQPDSWPGVGYCTRCHLRTDNPDGMCITCHWEVEVRA